MMFLTTVLWGTFLPLLINVNLTGHWTATVNQPLFIAEVISVILMQWKRLRLVVPRRHDGIRPSMLPFCRSRLVESSTDQIQDALLDRACSDLTFKVEKTVWDDLSFASWECYPAGRTQESNYPLRPLCVLITRSLKLLSEDANRRLNMQQQRLPGGRGWHY